MRCKFASHTMSAGMALALATVLYPVMATTLRAADALTASQASADTSIIDKAIEALYQSITSAGQRPLPLLVVDYAERAYRHYRIYRLGGRVEEVRATVHAVMVKIDSLRQSLEEGREISSREYRLVHELLDAQLGRLDAIAMRVTMVEERTAEQAVRMRTLEAQLEAARSEAAFWRNRFRRPGCGTGRYYSYEVGHCISAAAAKR